MPSVQWRHAVECDHCRRLLHHHRRCGCCRHRQMWSARFDYGGSFGSGVIALAHFAKTHLGCDMMNNQCGTHECVHMLATRRELSAESPIGIWLLGVRVYVCVRWGVFVFTGVCRSTVITHSSHSSRVAIYALQKRHFHKHKHMHVRISPDTRRGNVSVSCCGWQWQWWFHHTRMCHGRCTCMAYITTRVRSGKMLCHWWRSTTELIGIWVRSRHRARERRVCAECVIWNLFATPNRNWEHSSIYHTCAISSISRWLALLASTERAHRIGSGGTVRTWSTVNVTPRVRGGGGGSGVDTTRHDNNNNNNKNRPHTNAHANRVALRECYICIGVCVRVVGPQYGLDVTDSCDGWDEPDIELPKRWYWSIYPHTY